MPSARAMSAGRPSRLAQTVQSSIVSASWWKTGRRHWRKSKSVGAGQGEEPASRPGGHLEYHATIFHTSLFSCDFLIGNRQRIKSMGMGGGSDATARPARNSFSQGKPFARASSLFIRIDCCLPQEIGAERARGSQQPIASAEIPAEICCDATWTRKFRKNDSFDGRSRDNSCRASFPRDWCSRTAKYMFDFTEFIIKIGS